MFYSAMSRVGNYLHLMAMIALLWKIWRTKSCTGISVKSQFLYALVFTTRYLDLFTTFITRENTVLKISYILLTYCTVFSMILFFWRTHEKKYDTDRLGVLLIPCIVAALLLNREFTCSKVLWTFSQYLEAVAMIPQFHFILKSERVHPHVVAYIAAIAIYKGLYIAQWAYRYNYEGYFDKFSVAAGLVQYILYWDFFLQIWPWLCPSEDDKQLTVATIETGVPKTGHLANNVGNVVLTPGCLTGLNKGKENFLAARETVQKY